jgi:hypothetical protein
VEGTGRKHGGDNLKYRGGLQMAWGNGRQHGGDNLQDGE